MRDVIEVTGTGTASAPADLVTVELRVECAGATVAEALSELSRRLPEVLAAAHGHEPAPRSIATTDLGVHLRHDRDGRVAGHTAYQRLRISSGEPDRAGDLIARLGEAAGDTLGIDGLSLEVAEPAPFLAQARDAAFADARARAEQHARLAGRALGPVRSVREVPPVSGPRPMVRMAMAADMSTPVTPGQQDLTVSVTVRWDLR